MSDDSADLILEVEVDGKRYIIKSDDLTAADDLAIYQKTGVTLGQIVSGQVTLFTVAALLWVHRRHTERDLQFEEVAKHMKMKDLLTVQTHPSGESEAGPNP